MPEKRIVRFSVGTELKEKASTSTKSKASKTKK
ncbi:hypothetical protein h2es_0024 [Rickettsiales endosymbiont of Trichoplax sp. H2]|nr:hypothetical protein [Rickettsiales endosymbiont of Trichoplax sp. H2]